MIDGRTPDAGASHMQLTKLKAATAAQISACHQRSLNVSSNSARVNSQNTTTLPVDSAITGACTAATGDVAPIDAVTACAADPSAKAAANRPASTVPKPRNSDAASTSSSATVAPRKAMSMVESIIRSGPFAQSSAHRQSSASCRVVQFARISPSMWPASHPALIGLAEQINFAILPRAQPPCDALGRFVAGFDAMDDLSISKVANTQSIDARAASTA